MSDLVGKKLKGFHVLRRLGRGAMAEVYLAQQLSLGRQVALKVLNSELARDPNYVRRFHHEARAAAALVHGGIVQVYEVGEENGVHYIAQEYVAGRNLGEIIRGRGSVTPSLALDIMRQVASALVKAASVGIVHRDIKPENIMLASSGEVKVADFGLARVEGDGAELTQVGVTMGTPLYMSPEQIEGRPLDSRSDIYSLGVTAYHMLAGEPPFIGDTPLAVAVQHLNQPSVPLAGRTGPSAPNVSPRLSQVIDRMMAKKPAERFGNPLELSSELHSLAEEGIQQGWAAKVDHSALHAILQAADQRAAATSRLDELMKTTAMVRPRRVRARWIAAGILACALLGAGLAMLMRPRWLLAGGEPAPAPADTVWKQLYQAKLADTEAAWMAVAENFPDENRYYHNLAKQGLVHYYFRRQEYGKAIRPLQELAALGNSLPSFQAFGIAGLVVADVNLGDDERASDENRRLTPDLRELLETQSPRMYQLLNEALDELTARSL